MSYCRVLNSLNSQRMEQWLPLPGSHCCVWWWHSRKQLPHSKKQTMTPPSSLEIFGAGSLVAILLALTFRSKANPCCLCYVLDLCSSCHCERTVLGWRRQCPVAVGAFCISCCSSAMWSWNSCQNCSDLTPKPCASAMDYLLLIKSIQRAPDYQSPNGWSRVTSASHM